MGQVAAQSATRRGPLILFGRQLPGHRSGIPFKDRSIVPLLILDRTNEETWELPLTAPGSPFDSLKRAEISQRVRREVARLGEPFTGIIRDRFGLNDDEPQTLERIGSRLGLSRERIRQLEAEALTCLRGRLHDYAPRGIRVHRFQ